MHTFATFIAAFAEFSETDQAYVQAKLDEAALDIDECVWGTRATVGHGNLTAHLLVMSPYGNGAKLVEKETKTYYEIRYKALLRAVTAGIRST